MLSALFNRFDYSVLVRSLPLVSSQISVFVFMTCSAKGEAHVPLEAPGGCESYG